MAGQDDSKTSPTKSYAQAASEGVERSSENSPPPYTSQHGQASSTPAPPQPHRQRSQQPLLRPLPSGGSVVVVVSHHAIGVARARSRFFGALFWAIIIYLVAGLAVPIALFSITSKSY